MRTHAVTPHTLILILSICSFWGFDPAVVHHSHHVLASLRENSSVYDFRLVHPRFGILAFRLETYTHTSKCSRLQDRLTSGVDENSRTAGQTLLLLLKFAEQHGRSLPIPAPSLIGLRIGLALRTRPSWL